MYIIFLICHAVSLFINFISLSGRRAKRNYIYNEKISKKHDVLGMGYIENQTRLSAFRYGMCSFDFNGCGAAAIYNIMYYYNKVENFASLIYSLEKSVFVMGLLGTSPIALKKFLKNNGFSVKLLFGKRKILKYGRKSDCVIHLYFRRDFSAHFVTGTPSENGKYCFHNGSVKPDNPVSLSEHINIIEGVNTKRKNNILFNCVFAVNIK